MSVQYSLPIVRDGLYHTVCGQPIDCRSVMRVEALGIVESVPFCERCNRVIPVKELA